MHKKSKEYMDIIVSKGSSEDMITVEHCFLKLLCEVDKHCPELAHETMWCLRDLACGPDLTLDEAECWVRNMVPAHRWTKDETDAVRGSHRVNEVSAIDFYVIMNKLYSDDQKTLGDPIECLDRYVEATKEWVLDADAKPHKVYNYYKHVAKN